MGYSDVYYKGGSLFYEMEQRMGEEKFRQALREYVRTFAYGMVDTEQFRQFWLGKGDFSEERGECPSFPSPDLPARGPSLPKRFRCRRIPAHSLFQPRYLEEATLWKCHGLQRCGRPIRRWPGPARCGPPQAVFREPLHGPMRGGASRRPAHNVAGRKHAATRREHFYPRGASHA